MKRILVIGALIVVVVAIVNAIVGNVFDTSRRLGEVLTEALACAIVLAPLINWILGATTITPVERPSDQAVPNNIDPVSNTLNLRGLTINLLEFMALAERYDRELSVVMLSMDDTDDVHERYGDDGVEAALLMMGETLVETLRVPDRSGRYQGDTFLLILPETNADGARLIAERVRRAVVESSVRSAGRGSFSITASAGVTTHRPGDDPQSITARAQAALTEARSLGQNRTVMLDESS